MAICVLANVVDVLVTLEGCTKPFQIDVMKIIPLALALSSSFTYSLNKSVKIIQANNIII